MVRCRFVLLWSIWCSVVMGLPLQYLERSTTSQTAFDSTVGFTQWHNPKDNQDKKNILLGFSFPFNNTTFTKVTIGTDGVINFGGDADFLPPNLPLPHSAMTLYAYWDDLDPSSGGQIVYGSVDVGLSTEHYVISWENIPHHDGTGNYNFQVVFYPNGSIRFRYDAASSTDGSSATVGVQESLLYYDQYSYNGLPFFNPTVDILYTPKSNITLVKNSIVISDPVSVLNPKRIPGAIIRYCFTADNTGAVNVDNVTLTDSITGNGKENLTYVRSGFVLQDSATACDCAGIIDTSGSLVGSDVTIAMGTLTGTILPATSRGCAYMEMVIQ